MDYSKFRRSTNIEDDRDRMDGVVYKSVPSNVVSVQIPLDERVAQAYQNMQPKRTQMAVPVEASDVTEGDGFSLAGDLSREANYGHSIQMDPNSVEGIIFHHTGGRGTPEGVLQTLNQRGLGVNFIMDRDGKIYEALPKGMSGAHMLPAARFQGSANPDLTNHNTIGIEMIARDNKDLTPAQIAAAQQFYNHMHEIYPHALPYGHGEVNPGHKEADEGMGAVLAIRKALKGDNYTQVAFDPSSATEVTGSIKQPASNRPAQQPGGTPMSALVDDILNRAKVKSAQPNPIAQAIEDTLATAGLQTAAPPQQATPAPAAAFDASTAQPVPSDNTPPGFDASSAQPMQAPQQPSPTPPAMPARPSIGIPALDAFNAGIEHAVGNIPNLMTAAAGYGMERLGNMLGLSGAPQSFTDMLRGMNASDAALMSQHPIASTLGNVAGVAGSMGNAGVHAAAPVASSLFSRLGSGAVVGGVPAAISGYAQNGDVSDAVRGGLIGAGFGALLGGALPPAVSGNFAARTAAGTALGAGAGGIIGYANNGPAGAVAGAGAGAAIGAGGGAIAAPSLRAIGGVIRNVASPNEAALQWLASKVALPGEAAADTIARIKDGIARFKAVYHTTPSMAQLMPIIEASGEAKAREIGEVTRLNAKASQTVNQAADVAAISRQSEVQNAIAPKVTSKAALDQANSAKMTAAMEPIRNDMLPLTEDDVNDVSEIIANVPMPRLVKKRVVEEMEAGHLTIGSVDYLRQRLNKLNASDPGAGYDVMRDTINDIGSQHAGYTRALDRFATRAQIAEGHAAGTGVLTTPENKSSEYIGTYNAARPAEKAGYPSGAHAGLRGAAGTPAGAERVARRLAEDTGLNSRIAAVTTPQEAARLQNVGTLGTQAAKGINAMAQRGVTPTTEEAQNQAETARAVLTAVHGASTSTLAHVFSNVFRRLQMPPAMIQRIAEIATRPGGSRLMVNFLRQRGATPTEARQITTRWLQMAAGTAAGRAQ